MKVLSVIFLIGLVYGFWRFMQMCIKELAEFVIEAWRNGETEH